MNSIINKVGIYAVIILFVSCAPIQNLNPPATEPDYDVPNSFTISNRRAIAIGEEGVFDYHNDNNHEVTARLDIYPPGSNQRLFYSQQVNISENAGYPFKIYFKSGDIDNNSTGLGWVAVVVNPMVSPNEVLWSEEFGLAKPINVEYDWFSGDLPWIDEQYNPVDMFTVEDPAMLGLDGPNMKTLLQDILKDGLFDPQMIEDETALAGYYNESDGSFMPFPTLNTAAIISWNNLHFNTQNTIHFIQADCFDVNRRQDLDGNWILKDYGGLLGFSMFDEFNRLNRMGMIAASDMFYSMIDSYY